MNGKQLYYFIGQILSTCLHENQKDTIIQDLKSPDFNWNKFIALGSNHLVLQAIYCKLRDRGLQNFLPKDIHSHLEHIYDLNYNRNSDIMKQVHTINQMLNAEGIIPMYIKGVGNILDSLYSDMAERIMFDIDIYVNQESLDVTMNILLQNGYLTKSSGKLFQYSKAKHLPPLIKEDETAVVEIHRYPVEFIYRDSLSNEEIWKDKKLIESLGKCYVMSDKHKIIHNFIHSQLEHHGHSYARIFIRNLYDLLLLSGRQDIGIVFNNMNRYRSKTKCYMNVMEETFNIKTSGIKKSNFRISLFRLQYNVNLASRPASLIVFYIAFIFRLYILIPIRLLSDKELRKSIPGKLFSKGFYKRHYKSISRNKKRNQSFD